MINSNTCKFNEIESSPIAHPGGCCPSEAVVEVEPCGEAEVAFWIYFQVWNYTERKTAWYPYSKKSRTWFPSKHQISHTKLQYIHWFSQV